MYASGRDPSSEGHLCGRAFQLILSPNEPVKPSAYFSIKPLTDRFTIIFRKCASVWFARMVIQIWISHPLFGFIAVHSRDTENKSILFFFFGHWGSGYAHPSSFLILALIKFTHTHRDKKNILLTRLVLCCEFFNATTCRFPHEPR